MPLDLTQSTVNTSGGVRGRLRFQKAQDHYQIPAKVIEELTERGYIVLDKDDLVDAVAQLLTTESGRLSSLIQALQIPGLSSTEGNLITLDDNGDFLLLEDPDALKAPLRVIQTASSAGANITFAWPSTPFADTQYSFQITCLTTLAAAWSYNVVSKDVDKLVIDLQGIAAASNFQLIAEGPKP